MREKALSRAARRSYLRKPNVTGFIACIKFVNLFCDFEECISVVVEGEVC